MKRQNHHAAHVAIAITLAPVNVGGAVFGANAAHEASLETPRTKLAMGTSAQISAILSVLSRLTGSWSLLHGCVASRRQPATSSSRATMPDLPPRAPVLV
jgi:hypothetical protein